MNNLIAPLCTAGIDVKTTYKEWVELMTTYLASLADEIDHLDQLLPAVFLRLLHGRNAIWSGRYEYVMAYEFDTLTDQTPMLLDHWDGIWQHMPPAGRLETIWDCMKLTDLITNHIFPVGTRQYVQPAGVIDATAIEAVTTEFTPPAPPEWGTRDITKMLMGNVDLRQCLLDNRLIDQFRYIRDIVEVNETLIVYLTTDESATRTNFAPIQLFSAPTFNIIIFEENGYIRNVGTYRQPDGTTDVEKYEREGRNDPPFPIDLSNQFPLYPNPTNKP